MKRLDDMDQKFERLHDMVQQSTQNFFQRPNYQRNQEPQRQGRGLPQQGNQSFKLEPVHLKGQRVDVQQLSPKIPAQPDSCTSGRSNPSGGQGSLMDRLVGRSNDAEVIINGILTNALLDTGSMVTTMTESFYQQLADGLILHDLKNLVVNTADGSKLPYIGYVEAEVSIPSVMGEPINIPILVISTADSGCTSAVPIIIGTNFLRPCMNQLATDDPLPGKWGMAFSVMKASCDSVGSVKFTGKRSLAIAPGETVIVSGLVRLNDRLPVSTAVTEHSTKIVGGLTVCPRVVSLNSVGTTDRVPVRICNISAKTLHLKPDATVSELQEVKVLRSWKPDTEDDSCRPTEAEPMPDVASFKESLKIDRASLSTDQFNTASSLLCKWESIFSKGITDLGCSDVMEHEIRLTDETPFKDPYRRIPPAMYEEVREHLKEMLDSGAIRPSHSPFSSNVVLVRKKDNSLRFCIDFRKLNARTVKDAYSLPRIEESIDTLSGSRYFSKLDLRSGYWQVPIKECAFSVGPLGFWECNRMAFG